MTLDVSGIRLTSPECKVLLPNWIDSKPDLALADELFGVGTKSYLGICISPSGRVFGEVSSHAQHARLIFTNLAICGAVMASDCGSNVDLGLQL